VTVPPPNAIGAALPLVEPPPEVPPIEALDEVLDA
jgi:hypothetical protein